MHKRMRIVAKLGARHDDVGPTSLFFACDHAVARDRVVARAFANKPWASPRNSGQLLIA